MRKILVLTGDMIGRRMAGPAIRAFEMARILSAEHSVVLSCPAVNENRPDVPESLTITTFGNEPAWDRMDTFDAVILPGSMHVDAHIAPPVVVDLYDPYILSSLPRTDKSSEKQLEELLDLKRNLQRGDYFVCASERQRDFWLGMLASEGRINVTQFQSDPHMEHLIGLAPFGIDEHPPETGDWLLPGNPDAFWLVWAGGIWDWFDPLTLIHAVHTVNQQTGHERPVCLYFMGTQHPNPNMTNMAMADRARHLADDLNMTQRSVFFGEWIPYEQRGAVLRSAHAGVSCHYPHLETRFSFRTRILDYVWARIPFLCTDGDVFGEICRERETGIAIAPESVDEWSEAILRLMTDTQFYSRCRDNLDVLAKQMTWKNVLSDVTAFCRAPHRASDADRTPFTVTTEKYIYAGGCETAVEPAGEILNRGLIQHIAIPGGGLNRMDLKLATYGRRNNGVGVLDVLTADRKSLVRIPFDLESVVDNHWRSFILGTIPVKPGDRIILHLTAWGTEPGNTITVWVDPGVENMEYRINNRIRPGSINFRMYRESGSVHTPVTIGRTAGRFRSWLR